MKLPITSTSDAMTSPARCASVQDDDAACPVRVAEQKRGIEHERREKQPDFGEDWPDHAVHTRS